MKPFAKLFCILLLCAMLLLGAACRKTGDAPAAETPAPAEGAEYAIDDPLLKAQPVEDNARVFYEIFLGSFSDSNGDGVGDLRGLINRLDYLNDGDPDSGKSLGIEGIWLTPIFTSPSYHKYDVTDYREIDPQFGTQEDLDELIGLCHERNVKLILDMPINHTSRMCKWFGSFTKAHRNEDPTDPYYDFYCYYKKGTSAPAGRTFAALSGTDIFYECNFDGGMPELNFDNPAVREEILSIMRYYLERGIDGFRFDAAKYVYFGEHDRSVAYWLELLNTLREQFPEMYTIAEVWDGDGITAKYYPATNCFNFTTAQTSGVIAETAKQGDAGGYARYVESYLNSIADTNPDAMFVPFVANHDTDRAAGFLPTASGFMQMAANLYILGPGSPFLYYGEEIGMRGSRGGANTDANRRLAMIWGDDDTVKDPVGTTYDRSNQIQKGVKDQVSDPNSLYTYYKKLIMIRKANPEIARGEYHAVNVKENKVGGFTSTLNGKTVLVLHNPSMSGQTVDISQFGSFTTLCAVIGIESATLDGTTLTIGGQTSVVIR